MASLIVVGAYFVILPLVPVNDRDSVRGMAPASFAIGLLIGAAMFAADRFGWAPIRGITATRLTPFVMVLVGILIVTDQKFLFPIFIGLAGAVAPVATPLFRLPSPPPQEEPK